MDHIEPDELAVLALDGAEPDDAVRAHLDSCAACRDEYDALVRTVVMGRGGAAASGERAGDATAVPSSSVWAGIHAELGLAAGLAPDPLAERCALPELSRPCRHRRPPRASPAPWHHHGWIRPNRR